MNTNCPDCVWDIEKGVIYDYTPCETCRVNTLHDSHVDVHEWKWPEAVTHCFRCNSDMRSPNPNYPEELDNEAIIAFTGGYGSFIDVIDGKWPMAVICHSCAHELCEEFLGIDPRNWHTHSTLSGQHPDHHDNHQ